MLEKLTKFMIKYRPIVLLVFAVVLALSIVGTVFLVLDDSKINSDMMSYLSEDFDTRKGLDFLQKNFGIRGDAMIVVRGEEEDAALKESVAKIKQMDGISQLIWVEDAATLATLKEELSKLDFDEFGSLNTEEIKELLNGNPLLASMGLEKFINLMGIKDMEIDATALQEYLKRPLDDGSYDYVLMIMTNYAPSTSEAYALLDAVKAELSPRSLASSGMTETAQTVMDDTLSDLPNFLIYAILAVIIILLLTTPSFVDPLIIMLTLGISIIISMGINYLYPSISIISFATSAVLQLAITMDYSIFYMHIYKKNRKSMEPLDATVKAVPEVASSILASGLTTIGGFVALYFMRFGIGADIAGVIIKGVVMSLLTILILQPIITIFLDKAIAKSTHRFLPALNEKIRVKNPNFKGVTGDAIVKPVAKFAVWQRIVLVIIAVGLLVPSFIGQSKLSYSYFQMYDSVLDTPEKTLAAELGNQMIMAVPLNTVTGTQQDFIKEVLEDPNGKVSGITGAFTSVNIDNATLISMLDILTNETSLNTMEAMLKNLPSMMQNEAIVEYLAQNGFDVSLIDWEKLDLENIDIKKMLGDVDLSMLNSYFAEVNGKWYTMYTVSISGSTEDEAAAETYEYLLQVRQKYFGRDGYSIGMLTGSYDMREVTPTDFLRVTIASALIILVILSLLLRNPVKSLILVLLIELGIWLNLSLTFLLGEQLNFMIYIIISSVQLGCTVDYAILLANTFEKNRSRFTSSKECAIKSASEAVPAIFVSALLIIAVCMSVYFVSQNLIIKQLTGMLARGAAISFILVTFIQTAVMSFFKTERRKTDYASKIKKLEEKLQNEE